MHIGMACRAFTISDLWLTWKDSGGR